MSIVHQSPSQIVLTGKDSIPIFCIGSGHSLDFEYKWNSGDNEIPGNSPVLWISSPGTYRCVVSSGWYSCSSRTIVIKEKGSGKCVLKVFSSVLGMENIAWCRGEWCDYRDCACTVNFEQLIVNYKGYPSVLIVVSNPLILHMVE